MANSGNSDAVRESDKKVRRSLPSGLTGLQGSSWAGPKTSMARRRLHRVAG
jgi:hypothetical protein